MNNRFDQFDATPCNFVVVEPIPDSVATLLKEDQEKIREAMRAAAAERKIEQVLFVAVGGSWCSLFSGNYIVQRQAKQLKSELINANDFNIKARQNLGENTVVVLASHSGTTAEVVEAANYAREKGCYVVSITGGEASPLAKAAHFPAIYKVPGVSVAQNLLGSLVALYLLQAVEPSEEVDQVLAEHQKLPELLRNIKEAAKNMARQAADKFGGKQDIYVLGSGISRGLAYKVAVISLQEFAWVRANFVDTGEFFHGPLEIVEKGLPMLFIMDSNEKARTVTERVIRFVDQLGADYFVFDAKELAAEASEYITWFTLFFATQWFTFYMGMCQNHNPDDKRYMGVLKY